MTFLFKDVIKFHYLSFLGILIRDFEFSYPEVRAFSSVHQRIVNILTL